VTKLNSHDLSEGESAKVLLLTANGPTRSSRTRFAARWRLLCALEQLGLLFFLLIRASFAEAFAAEEISTGRPFIPLRVYYISPTGNDHRSGMSPDGAWATPHHNVNCGDVIIAQAGRYTTQFQSGKWGTVSNCPSTTGGIDGAGGIYAAVVLCAGPNLSSCPVNGFNSEAAKIDESNWALEGFTGTNSITAGTNCFTGSPSGILKGTSLHHIMLINDIASNCGGDGFDTYPSGGATGESSVDQTAVVGVIAYGAGQSGAYCNSGVSMIPTDGPDTSSGTHVFVGAAFTYHNIDNPICAGFKATITTALAASPGILTSTSFFTPFEPLKFSVTAGSLPNGLNSSTIYYVCSSGLVRNVSFEVSTTLNCVTPVTFTTAGKGAIKAQSLKTSDGEGVILDSFGLQAFTYQAAVEQSAAWGNGSSGYQIFPNGGTDQSDNYIFSVSSYGNLRDFYHDANNSSEVNFNQVHVGATSIKLLANSLIQATTPTPGGWPYSACARGNTQGCPVYGNAVAGRPVSAGHAIVTDNYFKGLANSCAGGGTCDPSFTFIAWDGNNAQSALTNTIRSPGFANPDRLPAGAPNCAAFANVTDCMNVGYGVAADLAPSGGAVGKGYQPPGPCRPDPYFPVWLKGVIFLHWNGSKLTEDAGLITKPCNL
jgi:hypothetical protein